ncbi:MAG TPA: TraR/DksA family transcriptional regulator [Aliiroseovarius sp.]|nr:TraR/DksA family transcriptional regulator [Aliiroseovarius sp.]
MALNERDVRRYRDRLLDELAALKAEDALGKDAQKVVTLDQQSVGRLSRMDALQGQAMARATQARRDQQRQKIAAALVRIDEGEFGYCIDSGEEISCKRLELDPTAAKCIGCAR